MITIKKQIEMVLDPIIKIRAITSSNDYIEIRFKDNWLDVQAGKEEGSSMRDLYRKQFEDELGLQDIFDILEIRYE